MTTLAEATPTSSTDTAAAAEGPWYRQVNRDQWRAFWAVFLGWIVDSFDFNILTFIIIDIQKSFTVDNALAGALGTVTLFMRLAGGTIAGTAADKWGRKGPLMVSVTAFGRVPPGQMVHRSGAKPGDRVMVTGTIGDAALGLAILKGGKIHAATTDTAARETLVGRYRVPQPRVVLAEIVRAHASAAMDVSDGLAGDLTKLCGVSDVSAAIDLASIPLSDAARDLVSRGIVGPETLIASGDDYEILCTIAEDRVEVFAKAAKRAGVPVSSIGTVVAGSAAPKFIDGQGREITLDRRSYSHF